MPRSCTAGRAPCRRRARRACRSWGWACSPSRHGTCARANVAATPSPCHRKDVSKPAFLAAVHRVLTEPGFRAAAAEVRDAYAQEDGAAAAARLIEVEIAAPAAA